MQELIEKLKAKLVAAHPMFTHYILETPFEPDESVKTLATNGERILYNPTYFAGCSTSGQAFRYLHELGHDFLDHHSRHRLDWDEEVQQRAMDYEVNGLLVASGFKMPSDGLYEWEFEGKIFEEIYPLLMKEKEAEKDSNWSKKRDKWSEDKHGKQEQTSADSEEEKEAVKERSRKNQTKAVQIGKMMGDMSQELVRKLNELMRAEINWRDVLAEFVIVNCGKDDFTMSRPNRRYDMDIIMPSMYSESTPGIGIFCDTSISVSSEKLKLMVGEIVGLAEQVEPELLVVIWCDAKVKGVQTFEDGEMPELVPKGGGGTSFIPPFKYIDEHEIELEAAIYLTDGECSRFAPEPDYPVMWIIWGGKRNFHPPYGTVTHMEI